MQRLHNERLLFLGGAPQGQPGNHRLGAGGIGLIEQ
jgi:hypothetical protein